MPTIQMSQRDLNKGTIVDPGWYRVRIESVNEAPAKVSEKGPSTNYPVEGTILFNGDTGDTKFTGVALDWNFNSKALGFTVGYLKALGVEVKANTRYDLAATSGLELDVFVENGEWQGRLVNRINHKYRPVKPEVKAMQ